MTHDPGTGQRVGATADRSPALRAVVAAVVVEAVLLAAVALFFGAEIVLGDDRAIADVGTAAAIAVLALLIGAFLAFCARALWRRRRWARGPVVTWQLLTVLGVVPSLGGERWWPAALVLLLCVVAGGGLFLPRVVAETTGDSDPPVV